MTMQNVSHRLLWGVPTINSVLCQASADYCSGVLQGGDGSHGQDRVGVTLTTVNYLMTHSLPYKITYGMNPCGISYCIHYAYIINTELFSIKICCVVLNMDNYIWRSLNLSNNDSQITEIQFMQLHKYYSQITQSPIHEENTNAISECTNLLIKSSKS